jgi:hypothetical protein
MQEWHMCRNPSAAGYESGFVMESALKHGPWILYYTLVTKKQQSSFLKKSNPEVARRSCAIHRSDSFCWQPPCSIIEENTKWSHVSITTTAQLLVLQNIRCQPLTNTKLYPGSPFPYSSSVSVSSACCKQFEKVLKPFNSTLVWISCGCHSELLTAILSYITFWAYSRNMY